MFFFPSVWQFANYIRVSIFVSQYRSSIQTNRTSWEEFYMDINERELYPENSQPLKRLLRDMAMLDIVHVGKFFLCVCDEGESFKSNSTKHTHTHTTI